MVPFEICVVEPGKHVALMAGCEVVGTVRFDDERRLWLAQVHNISRPCASFGCAMNFIDGLLSAEFTTGADLPPS